jgi:hypothetical protein
LAHRAKARRLARRAEARRCQPASRSGSWAWFSAGALCAWLCACSAQPSSVGATPATHEPESRAQKKPRVEITVLATADEGSSLLPAADGSGGAARTLGYWHAREAHGTSAPDGSTIALSAGGDDAAAPGQAVAQTLHAMSYSASIAGRPELEHSQIAQVGVRGGTPLRIERQGVKIDIIGLAKKFAGEDPVPAVRGQVLSLRDRGADVGILLSDACTTELADMLRREARDWAFLVLTIGRACATHEREMRIYSGTLLAADAGFQHYLRAKLTFDRNTGALLRADTGTVPVTGDRAGPLADPALAASLDQWLRPH